MEKVLTYQNNSISENTWLISEGREEYIKHLDSAIEEFNKKLENIEKRCFVQGENPDELLTATTKVIMDMMHVCEEFERIVNDKDVIHDARISFREKTNPILSKSYFINRARTWPQGHQGDYKTLEIAYKNMPLSEGIGYYLDLSLLNVTLAHAVRNRIRKLEDILSDEISKRQQPSVLNIACGSCRELMGLVPDISASGAKVICIDNDNDALAFAENRLSYTGVLSQIEFRKYNAIRMFDDELNMMEFGKQDIIYSVGLFDYLPNDFLVKLLSALYNLLNPGGKLIAAFKDADRYEHQPFHWIVDWDGFLQRTKSDFDRLLYQAGIPDSAILETREESGVIIFYQIIK